MNVFRKVWLGLKVKKLTKGGQDTMDAIKSILGWLFKSKWAQGHRRQISIALMTGTAIITFLSGPLSATIPALASPTVQHFLLSAAAYFGIVGEIFKKDATKEAS